MKKLTRAAFVALLTVSFIPFVIGVAQAAPEPPAVGMASGIMIDLANGKILWSKDDKVQRAPASLTKILTALVVLENADLKATAAITPDARNAPGGRTYAEAGWTFSVEDLMWGMLLQSGNDSAISLAHSASPDGAVETFMKMANERAANIGATDSHFVNPHGYDEVGHMTTARDLALISMEAMKNQVFAQMVATKTHDVPWGNGGMHTFINHNKLLFRYPGAIGIKTGFTNAAGHCLVSAAQRDGHRLLIVALGAVDHYADSISLYDWGFANIQAIEAQPLGIVLAKSQPVRNAASSRHGLEVIELDPNQVAALDKTTKSPGSAPLLVPTIALAGAGSLSALMVRKRRRRHREFRMMEKFQRELEALGTSPMGTASAVSSEVN